jgi:thiol:disulfide interchange protein DsbD
MMKKLFYTLIAFLFTTAAMAQIQNPVEWSYEATKKSADTYEVVITALVDPGWHIYSQNTGKGGPLPTKVVFKPNPLLTLNGKIKELGKLEKVKDEIFKTDVLYFSNKVQYVQSIKLKGKVKTNISGTVDYMVCNDHECLPPTKKSFDIKLQ